MKAMAIEGRKHSLSTDYIMKVLGLEICADTLVGGDMRRGVSGGQKKRVTTGEMMVGPKKTLFMDEISTGLDSSTTYQIVKCIGNFVHFLEGTVLMALLQPAPEVFDLFDDIVLLSEGYIVYHGPRDRILEFFESLGFRLPPRKAVADFLQEVTSKKDQGQYWADKSKPYRFMPVSEIAEAFAEFEVGVELRKTLEVPFNKDESHPASLVKGSYALPKWDLFKASFEREVILIARNRFLYTFRTLQVGVVAFITATLFLRTNLSPSDETNGFLYLSTLFFALVHMMFNGFSEMSFAVARLPVLYKQRDNLFCPSWAFSIPSWILRIPYSFIESIIWSCIVYYTIGLAPEAGRFFRYMLLLFLIHQMAIGLFRLIGAIGKTMVVSQTFGSFALLVVFLLGGFVLSKDSIHPWWLWAFWISPLSYSQNAIAVNEFLAPRWKKLSSNGKQLYLNILESRGLEREDYWYWIAIGALIGYMFLFNLLVTVALGYLDPRRGSHALSSRENLVSNENRERDNAKAANKMVEINMQSMEISSSTSSKRKDRREGISLPFQPLSLTFQNVCYYVDMPPEMRKEGVKGERLQLLRNVSGAFRPRILTALLGVSGAGKTTLMDVLAGRKTGGYIEGEIRISGYPKVQETFARVAGYVEQTDIHSPQLTVKESLAFSSLLRLPRETSLSDRKAFVEEVMNLVELDTLRDALVGLQGSTGLSTEQRKRLTIAVELVANPSIIFMDEPTSGLDAKAAAVVMRTVRNAVNTGRTIVCTIHQPSIDIFESFDELILMKNGGRIIYGGPLGKNSSLMIEYFQSIDGVIPIKDGQNPATWMLEISTPYAEANIGKDLADTYLNSNVYKNYAALIEQLSVPANGQKDLEFSTTYSQTLWKQLRACLWKQQITYWRSPEYNAVRFFFTFVCAVLFGTIFFNLGTKRKTLQDVANVMGALYASVLFLGVNNASSVQPVVAIERTSFYRERAAGMYHVLPYAIAQGLIEIPYILVQTLVYGTITYAMINFEWDAGKYFYYMVCMFLTFTYFTFYGMVAVGLSPSQQLAAVISSAFYSVWNLFSGFLIPFPKMPRWWSWYYYVCPVGWTLHGLVGSQLGNVNTLLMVPGGQTTTVAQYIRTTYGFVHEDLTLCLGVLAIFAVGFWFAYAFALKFLNHQRR
ncbi:hypothetical protein KP509_04G032700 [Ceratopteris richardii]|nr:hypothetical protein KP509_04G032700 [Ceratopteris richardii]